MFGGTARKVEKNPQRPCLTLNAHWGERNLPGRVSPFKDEKKVASEMGCVTRQWTACGPMTRCGEETCGFPSVGVQNVLKTSKDAIDFPSGSSL